MAEVDLSGKTVHEISSGLTDRDHTSLAADSGGHWVLYLAGSDLVASADASAPTVVSTAGFLATSGRSSNSTVKRASSLRKRRKKMR